MAEEEEIIEAGGELDFSKDADMDTDDDPMEEEGDPNMELSMREIE